MNFLSGSKIRSSIVEFKSPPDDGRLAARDLLHLHDELHTLAALTTPFWSDAC